MHDHKRTIIIPVMRKAHTGNLKSKRYGSFLNQKDLLTGTKQRNIIRTSGRFNKRLKKRREHKHEIYKTNNSVSISTVYTKN